MTHKIVSDVQIIKENYDSPVEILEGLNFSQKDTIKMVEFYSNSRYLGGQKDEKGREKAFYQILNGMCDVENAAVDIDTKDINITADDKESYIDSFLLSKDIYQWIKNENFAQTLNDMKKTRTKYGALLVKKCTYTKDGKKTLKLEVPEWKNVITDQIDIENSPIIEVHYMTPMEIMKKKEWKNTEDILKEASKMPGKRIKIYEVRGEFPVSYFNEVDGRKTTSKETEFSYQLYILGGSVEGKNNMSQANLMKPLYWENNTEKVYKYLSRKPKSGRAFGVGVFEEGEQAQVQINDVILKQNRALEYTSKVVGQSASKKLKGRNMYNEVEDGTILEHEENKPITALNLMPTGGLGQYENIREQWYQQIERSMSAYSAQRGDTPPSGTPFRLQASVLQQSSNVFEEIQEEFGIFITQIFNDWIIPFLSSTLNKEHLLAHDFSVEELQWMDKNIAQNAANRKIKEMILNGEDITPQTEQTIIGETMTDLAGTKNTRFFKMLKDSYKDVKYKVTVNVTGEQKNKAAVMETINNILTLYISNPNLATDPVAMQLFMKLVEISGAGISPVSLQSALQQRQSQSPQETTAQPPQPQDLSLEANPTQNA